METSQGKKKEGGQKILDVSKGMNVMVRIHQSHALSTAQNLFLPPSHDCWR
jgi:hypothetical protein